MTYEDVPFSGLDIIAISTGDPGGIGPEIVLKCFSDPFFPRKFIPLVVGDYSVIDEVNRTLGLGINLCRVDKNVTPEDTGDVLPVLDMGLISDVSLVRGEIADEYGKRASVEYLRKCVELGKSGVVRGVVTGPLAPISLDLCGLSAGDQSDLVAGMLGIRGCISMLSVNELSIFPCTGAIPLAEALSHLDSISLADTIVRAANYLSLTGKGEGSIAVTSLNPSFQFPYDAGLEEEQILLPAIEKALSMGVTAGGPFPGYGAFEKCIAGEYDGVVSMYYDQAFLTAMSYDHMKVIKVTFDLPFIHTSVLHGPNYEIAWKGMANPSCMQQAISDCVALSDSYHPSILNWD